MAAKTGILAALRLPTYSLYFWGNFASMTGTWMQRMAIGWLVWELTSSTWWLGIVAFADLFPIVFVGPFAGVVADRFDRRRMILITQSSSLATTLALLAASVFGGLNIYVVVAVVAVGGFFAGFDHPIRQSILGDLCEPDHLPDVVATNAMSFNLARVLGPAVAGIVLVHLGFDAVLYINAVSFAGFIVCVLRLRRNVTTHVTGGDRPGMLAELHDGYRFIRKSASLSGALTVLAVACLTVRPVFELLPAFADAVEITWSLADSAAAISLLATTLGIGAFAGVVAAPSLARRLGVTRTLWISIWLACLCLVLVAAMPRSPLLLGLLAMLSTFILVNSVAVQMIVHVDATSAYRGRALSLQSLIFRGGPALGAFCAGALAEWFGLSPVLFAFAAIGAVALLVTYSRRPLTQK